MKSAHSFSSSSLEVRLVIWNLFTMKMATLNRLLFFIMRISCSFLRNLPNISITSQLSFPKTKNQEITFLQAEDLNVDPLKRYMRRIWTLWEENMEEEEFARDKFAMGGKIKRVAQQKLQQQEQDRPLPLRRSRPRCRKEWLKIVHKF